MKPFVLIVGQVLSFIEKSFQGEFEYVYAADREAALQLPAEQSSRVQAAAVCAEIRTDAAFMDHFPQLKLISNFGVGYDNIDTAAAVSRGIAVTNTPGILSADVADLTVGLMLDLARRLPECDRYVREGRWATEGFFPLTAKVSGKKAGIVGLGRIGLEIAKRLRAFDMEIAFFGHHDVAGYTRMASLKELAAWCDFLILAVPGRPENRNLVDAEILQALGPQGRLINIARGVVVDEEALIAALQQGVIAGAALDVFVSEPHVDVRLRAMPDRTVLTSHVGTATWETRQDMADLMADNIRAFAAGLPLLTPVPECCGV